MHTATDAPTRPVTELFAQIAPATGAARPGLRLHPPHSAGRSSVEAFIADRYRREYGARVNRFLPMLVSVGDAAGALLAAAGLGPASAGPLFLEQYLDVPVEQAVSRRLGVAAQRDAVLEIGNLASASPGGGRLFIHTLVRTLAGGPLEWMLFTATGPLRNSLARLGIVPHELAAARPERLGAQQAEWGSYYDTDPRVVACSLSAAHAVLFGAGATA